MQHKIVKLGNQTTQVWRPQIAGVVRNEPIEYLGFATNECIIPWRSGIGKKRLASEDFPTTHSGVALEKKSEHPLQSVI